MATIDLGKIKLVWKGAYNNSTAYTPDDVVSSGGSSYICKVASTGNAVTNGTYWDSLAEGGDVATTLTTQGDVLYRDGSGLQRLAKGTANQILQMNSSANAPEWTAKPEGGLVHMLTQTVTSGTPATVDFIHGTSGVVFDSTYKHYTLMISDLIINSDNNVFGVRFRKSGSFQNSNYDYATECYEQGHGRNDSAGSGLSYGRLVPRNLGNQSNENFSCRIEIPNPAGSKQKCAYLIGGGRGGNGTANISQGCCIHTTDNAAMDGIQVIMGSGDIQSGIFSLYGIKSS